MLAGSLISWQAKKQSTIALSTAEAEYAALTQAAKEAIWLQNLLKDLKMSKYAPKVINVDNQGTIALANNPIHHARTKHLDIQLQFVRDSIENRIIALKYCPTDIMMADIMTKALAKDRHAGMRKLIGMDHSIESTSPSPIEDGPIG
jgi:KUP system potassium uptake protein